ncbi:MAG TPA: LamG domain-containing protein [Candidatus Saccharimonadia bacterium]|nr:LamG domain-containing protein [Candidatus Saccharimonadia bacterium]
MSYLSEQNTDNPIDRWRFEETTGLIIADDIASIHSGTISGGVTLNQSGDFVGSGLGAAFDGTSGYVSFGSASAMLGIGTVEATARFTAIAATTDIIFTHAWTSGQIIPLALGTNLDASHPGLLQVGYFTGSLWQTATWTTAPSLNTSYHIVGTYDGTTLVLYVNGTQVATSTPGTARPGSGSINTAAYIGSRWDIPLAQFHNGTISDVSLYGGALSGARVTAHYNALVSVTGPFADNFAGAGVLAAGDEFFGITTTAWTTEAGEPGSMSHTGWATFTPVTTGVYHLATIGSNFDTLLAVYTGTALNNLVLVASDDNSGGSGTSFLTATFTNGTTYYVQVGAQPAGAGGSLSFSLVQQATSRLTSVTLDALVIPTATSRRITSTTLDVVTVPTLVPRRLSAVTLDAAVIPTATPRTVSKAYLEVLTPAIYTRPFIGWGTQM